VLDAVSTLIHGGAAVVNGLSHWTGFSGPVNFQVGCFLNIIFNNGNKPDC